MATDQLSVTLLPAFEGDAIWIRWGERQMFVDMGRKGTGRQIATALRQITNRLLDLVVVTHVDVDHIGGVLTALVEPDDPIDGLEVNDIWFNGYRHLLSATETDSAEAGHNESDVEDYGVLHGFQLESWLENAQPWNVAFAGGPVMRSPGQPVPRVAIDDDLALWVVGPVRERLEALEPAWAELIPEEEAKLVEPDEPASTDVESYGGDLVLDDVYDLETLALTENGTDTVANGSSIALILEWRGRRILLAGDAFPDDLIDGIRAVDAADHHFDLVKLPHHGSRNNVTQTFADLVTADIWAFSTNGSRHHHPDPSAIARLLLSNIRRAERQAAPPTTQQLAFNVRSAINEYWDNPDRSDDFFYRTQYGSDDAGLELLIDPR